MLLKSLARSIDTRDYVHPDSSSADDLIGKSQHRLCQACITCLISEEAVDFLKSDKKQKPKYFEIWFDGFYQYSTLKQQLPFLFYATVFWFQHANKAESRGVSQAYLSEQLNSGGQAFKSWLAILQLRGS